MGPAAPWQRTAARHTPRYYGLFALRDSDEGWVQLSAGGITNDGIITAGGSTRDVGFTPWVFEAIAVDAAHIYGASQNRLVRARLP